MAKGVSKPKRRKGTTHYDSYRDANSESPRAMVKKPMSWGNEAVRNVQELDRVRAKERYQKQRDHENCRGKGAATQGCKYRKDG